jgi:hypothetical protein
MPYIRLIEFLEKSIAIHTICEYVFYGNKYSFVQQSTYKNVRLLKFWSESGIPPVKLLKLKSLTQQYVQVSKHARIRSSIK